MRISIDGSTVHFPSPSDYDALEPENVAGIAQYEHDRATAEVTVRALLLRAQAMTPAEPPALVKRLAELGRDVLRLQEQNLSALNLGEWIIVACERFKAGGPT